MSLSKLTVSQFITVPFLELKCYEGFTVITGESGAGKSLLFEALQIGLGKSPKSSVIRPGCEKASIELIFTIKQSQHELLNSFSDNGNDPLIIYREFKAGKSAVNKINSQTVTLKVLREVASALAIIVGQHEHIQLTKAGYQLSLLDKFARNEAALSQYQQAFKTYQDCLQALDTQKEALGNKEQELDFLNFQIQDIASKELKAEEEQLLETQKQGYKQAATQKQALSSALNAVSKSIEQQQEALRQMDPLKDSDEHKTVLTELISQSESLSYAFSKALNDVSELSNLNIDALESRLDTIHKLKNKYHCVDVAALLEQLDALESKRDSLVHAESNINELEAQTKAAEKALRKEADKLSKSRQQAATQLAKQFIEGLHALEFSYADFEVQFQASDTFLTNGLDQINFVISVNKGQALQPLSKVSSGGELSRILLVFYGLFSASVEQELLLFDEVDSGIGGLTGHALANYLKTLSNKKQIFCITHLAQIAQKASQHIQISKGVTDEQTVSTAKHLSDAEKQDELTRMMGGEQLIQQLI